jgi:ABC-type uncharacterized transport system ATPase subunit
MVVVIDDPLSSLDDYRTAMTAQEIRAIAERSAQVLVLSHSKQLLCSLAASVEEPAALEIRRDGEASVLVPWSVHDEAVTENDRRPLAEIFVVDAHTVAVELGHVRPPLSCLEFG